MKEISENEFAQYLELLNGKLPPNEAKTLRKAIDDQPEIKEQFEAVRLYQRKLKYIAARNELAAILAEEQQKVIEVPIPTRKTWWRRPAYQWVAAATVTLILGAGVFGWIKEQQRIAELERHRQEEIARIERLRRDQEARQRQIQSLTAKIPSLLAEPVQLEGISDKMTEKMVTLNDAIDEVAQQGAIKDLEDLGKPVRVTQERPTRVTYGAGENSGTVPRPTTRPQITASEEQYRRLLLGIGYLKENQLDKALVNLNQVTANQLQADVFWYKSLVLIQQKKYIEAKTELLKIQTNPKYQIAVKELLGGIPQ